MNDKDCSEPKGLHIHAAGLAPLPAGMGELGLTLKPANRDSEGQ